MTYANHNAVLKAACALLGLFSLSVAAASDVDDLTALLHEFLAASHQRAAHETFWADDLIYTSSTGARFGKAEILAGFEDVTASDEPPAVAYSAADIDVRVFHASAIVAFKLVGTPADGSAVLEYFNTGTFRKRGGNWQVVAWQATRIPAAGEGTD